MEGFYAVYYTGAVGFGHAVLIAKDGVLTGADVTGCLYDGSYAVSDSGDIRFDVILTAVAGTTLVTGQTLSETIKIEISSTLVGGFVESRYITLQTSAGPVNATFRKIRGM